MGKMKRITVTVPATLLDAVDRRLVNGNGTRSRLIRRLLEEALRPDPDDPEEVQRWIRVYQENPQTEEEFGWTSEAALRFFAEHPWKE